MKNLAFFFLFSAFAGAQAPVPVSPSTLPPVTPPAVSAPQPIPPDTVVGEVDGKKYTAAQVDAILKSVPQQVQVQMRGDLKRALSYVLLVQHLAEVAESQGLDKESPLMETLAFQRMVSLSQAEVNHTRNLDIKVEMADEQKFYQEHQDRFQEAKVKVVYVAFSSVPPKDPAAKKPLTEEEAKTKIEDLKKQIDAGADFGKVARENSDDKDSAAKDGDYGTMKRSSAYPKPLKDTVFAMKPGQVSDPVRQPNGFYLIKVESFSVEPYDQVRTQIFEDLKQEGFNKYMGDLQKRFEVKVENTAYFAPKAPVLPRTVAPPQTR